MTGPGVYLTLPRLSYFKLPPDPFPPTLPPPAEYHALRSPWPISSSIYDAALSPYVPLTVASVYVATAFVLNQLNRSRGYKPYAISKTTAFYWFVLLHNIGLAVFSAVSFLGIARAVSLSWPGFAGEHGLPGAVDALCRLNGPRGYGDAVTFNSTTELWQAKNRLIRLGPDGLTPDDTDVGRLWNEGLAFWGWIFYLSKFYEVVDTAIILAKGKRSSTLQTYHHSGAMLCMWAGIRYMSPPIWMWVFLNSAIHALMYTYYTLSTLNVRIPKTIKQTITTLQIGQMSFGFLFAAAHLFVSYSVPVSVSYSIASALGSVPSSVSSAASAATSAIKAADKSSIYSLAASATAGNMAWLKKLAFRAAGAEGLAENVQNDQGETFGAEFAAPLKRKESVQWRNEYQTVDCVQTGGQAFAVWLNVLYLLPLTILFMRFFYKSYISYGRSATGAKKSGMHHRLSESARAAAKETTDTVEKSGLSVEESIGDVRDEVGKPHKANGLKKDKKSEAEWFGNKTKKATHKQPTQPKQPEGLGGEKPEVVDEILDKSNILPRPNA